MLAPLFAMVLLIFAVLLLTLALRIIAVSRGEVSPKHFRLMAGEAPEYLLKVNRQVSNLFETPVLFFAVGILAIALQAETPLLVNLAWIYVVLRLAHAVIHLTYNHILHRLAVFMASVFCLLAMWVVVVFKS